ncbi:MAG TPA: response regulator transcription factor [Acidimicrobiales bacterium]|nr:response regulator transcription factor [Acidimicrobiales bacterium]
MSVPDHIEVVVADDEVDIRLLLKLQLRQAGITVVGEAGDGIETVEQCKALQPDVLILDLLMPRMNGFEAIPVLREECPDVAIIAYSAVAGEFARQEMERWGIPLRLKNGDAEPLVQTIRELAGQPAADDLR